MGVNMAGNCIVDDGVCREASRQEILRRYYTACVEKIQGKAGDEPVRKLELVMNQAGVTPEICPAVSAALLKAEATGAPAGAMVLPDGRVVTGKTSETLGAASALLLNALKALGNIDHHFELISAQVLEPVCRLKTGYLGHKNPRLHTDEVLLALTISALTNPWRTWPSSRCQSSGAATPTSPSFSATRTSGCCGSWASTSALSPSTRRRSCTTSKEVSYGNEIALRL